MLGSLFSRCLGHDLYECRSKSNGRSRRIVGMATSELLSAPRSASRPERGSEAQAAMLCTLQSLVERTNPNPKPVPNSKPVPEVLKLGCGKSCKACGCETRASERCDRSQHRMHCRLRRRSVRLGSSRCRQSDARGAFAKSSPVKPISAQETSARAPLPSLQFACLLLSPQQPTSRHPLGTRSISRAKSTRAIGERIAMSPAAFLGAPTQQEATHP